MESGEKDNKNAVDQQRRRLTKAAAVSPIVASLISRPVWGTTCSISGLQSGNLSGTAKTQCEGSGCTPGYWKNNPTSWLINTIYSPGTCKCYKGNNCKEWNGGTGTTFTAAFGVSPGGGYADSSMMDILLKVADQRGGFDKGNYPSILAHCIAALLNANSSPNTFGATTQQVIDAVSAAMTGTLVDNLGQTIPLEQLFRVLVDMNEAGGSQHCIYNAHGFCEKGEVSSGTECIPACEGNETYDMCSKKCVPEGTTGVVTVKEVLDGVKTLDDCP